MGFSVSRCFFLKICFDMNWGDVFDDVMVVDIKFYMSNKKYEM